MIEKLLEEKLEIILRIERTRRALKIARLLSPETIQECLRQSKMYQLESIKLEQLIQEKLH